MLRLQNFHGAELAPHLDDLGELRIAVFHEYPYLYAGTLEHERQYLGTYVRSSGSLVVLVFDDDRVVGATTCLPMLDEGPEFQAAFVQAGHDLSTICYFGESILLPAYRGQGMGKGGLGAHAFTSSSTVDNCSFAKFASASNTDQAGISLSRSSKVATGPVSPSVNA